jgi:four helix bundle protein
MTLISQKLNLKTQSQSSERKSGLRERCYPYSISVIKFLETLPEKHSYRILSDQLLRSATSIGANVVEAKSASSKRDFMHYYEIALKSANETTYWLSLLRDGLDVRGPEIEALAAETNELTRILAASLLTMKNRK